MKIENDRRMRHQYLQAVEVKEPEIKIHEMQGFDSASLDELRNNRKIYLDDPISGSGRIQRIPHVKEDHFFILEDINHAVLPVLFSSA